MRWDEARTRAVTRSLPLVLLRSTLSLSFLLLLLSSSRENLQRCAAAVQKMRRGWGRRWHDPSSDLVARKHNFPALRLFSAPAACTTHPPLFKVAHPSIRPPPTNFLELRLCASREWGRWRGVAGGGKLGGGLSGRHKKTRRPRELVDDGALEEISRGSSRSAVASRPQDRLFTGLSTNLCALCPSPPACWHPF